MPRYTEAIPKYRRHKASGQAIVTLNGRDYYLGPHGTRVSRREYDRLVGEWLAAGRRLTAAKASFDLNLNEVLVRFWNHATEHNCKNGKPTSELSCLKLALRPLKEFYGHTLAKDFTPLARKALQQKFIDAGICRTQINQRLSRIKRFMKWAASEQLIPLSVYEALRTVSGLRAGRTKARESKAVATAADGRSSDRSAGCKTFGDWLRVTSITHLFHSVVQMACVVVVLKRF